MEKIACAWKEHYTPFAKNVLYAHVNSETKLLSNEGKFQGASLAKWPSTNVAAVWFWLRRYTLVCLFILYSTLLREGFPASKEKKKETEKKTNKTKQKQKQENLI